MPFLHVTYIYVYMCMFAYLHVSDIALMVLDKCTDAGEEKKRTEENFKITFDYEFVEDFQIEEGDKAPTCTRNGDTVVEEGGNKEKPS